MGLGEAEKQRLVARVAAFEADTGVELVTAVVPRCDDYPELPWKGFALGAAVGATLVAGALPAGSADAPSGLVAVGATLGLGLVGALLAWLQPGVGRALLDRGRAEGEARQVAEGLFLEHELFATPARCGVLLLVATFERRVVVLPDRGLREALPADAFDAVVAAMAPGLGRDAWFEAFDAGIERLQALLVEHGVRGDTAARPGLPDHLEPPS